MRLTEQLRSVFLSVMANKFRVILTSLGIIIGAFTIIMVVGIGKASEASVAEQYKRLSVESITISRSMGTSRMFSTNGGTPTSPRSLTKEELETMPELLEHVRSIGISTSITSSVVYGGNSKDTSIMGINEDYAYITHLYLKYGELFTDDDSQTRNKVVVLGNDLAKTLFGEDEENLYDAIGESVRIKGTSFTVIGILERVGGSGGIQSRESVDDMAFIPYDVAVKYTTGVTSIQRAGAVMISASSAQTAYIALANDMKSVSSAIEEIKAYIDDICGKDSYTVTDVGSTLTSALKTSNTMSTLLIAVAVIVLIVSGIGIMNVLMVAVSERTREIGILKSLGAKRRTILSVFLLEAFFISVIGGLLGVCLSIYAPTVLKYFEIDFLATMDGLLLGLGFSIITGIFFGYYPAWKASKLKPIDALNKE